MKRIIRRTMMLVLLAVFLGAVGMILFVLKQYRDDEQLYDQASGEYTARQDEDVKEKEEEAAPIVVDFDALRQVNKDIVGWIYCENTVIDYPVMQGADNDLYLHHAYDGSYSVSGSIFVDSKNRPGFADSNTIIYGHHMKNGSMFATLSNWADQQYYEEHPVMWLLTPERDYKIVLFSGYTTSAYSDTYTMFSEPSVQMEEYLKSAVSKTDFHADAELETEGHYVLLSTCAYVFDNARYVLHGKLSPVDSAGGILFTNNG